MNVCPMTRHVVKPLVDVDMGRGIDQRAGPAIDLRVVTFPSNILLHLLHVCLPVDLCICITRRITDQHTISNPVNNALTTYCQGFYCFFFLSQGNGNPLHWTFQITSAVRAVSPSNINGHIHFAYFGSVKTRIPSWRIVISRVTNGFTLGTRLSTLVAMAKLDTKPGERCCDRIIP